MAWLRKTLATPGGAPGGLVWNTPEDVREVDDALAIELLAIPDAGFITVSAPKTQAEGGADGQDESGGETPAKSAAAKKAAAAKPAAKTPVAE